MRRFVFALLVALALVGGTALAAFSDGDQQPARAPATAPPDPAAFEEAAREVRSSMAGSPRDENDEKPERDERAARDRGEGKGPPPWAKAHGRRCKGKSKRKAAGQKHSEFVRCVHEGKGKAKAKGPKKARGPKPGKGPKKAKKSR